MDVRHFDGAAAFRGWLEANGGSAAEIWVGFYRKDSGRGGLSYPEAVDEALCFGWIDGIRRKIDGESYANRFTPRRKGSAWSRVNIARVGELEAAGRMAPAGLAAFAARTDGNSGVYSFEQREAGLSPEYEARLAEDAAARAFWERQPPSYRRIAGWWVMSAKREDTRERRLATLTNDCREGRRIALLRRPERGYSTIDE